MKTQIQLFFFLAIFPFCSRAQWIDNLWVTPANPAVTDTIRVFAAVSFPSGSCFQSTDTMFVSPPVISAYSLHCLGILTYICKDTDVFVLNPLPSGNYTFTYQVDAGSGPAPCTPGIVPGPVDSVIFHVGSSGMQEMNSLPCMQVLHSNGPGVYFLENSCPETADWPLKVNVFAISGQVVARINWDQDRQRLDLSFLEKGIYFLRQEGSASKGFKLLIP